MAKSSQLSYYRRANRSTKEGPARLAGLRDPEVFLLELGALHFLFHPTDHSTAPAPGELRVLLAAKLWRDFRALEPASSSRWPTAVFAGANANTPAQLRQLILQCRSFGAEDRFDFIAQCQKCLNRHRGDATKGHLLILRRFRFLGHGLSLKYGWGMGVSAVMYSMQVRFVIDPLRVVDY